MQSIPVTIIMIHRNLQTCVNIVEYSMEFRWTGDILYGTNLP